MKEVNYEDWQKNPTPREMWVWDDNEKEKIRDTSFCSGYNTAVSKYKRQNGELTDKVKELEAQIEKMKCLLNEIYSEYGFSELVKIRNNLPIEIQEVIKEIKER